MINLPNIYGFNKTSDAGPDVFAYSIFLGGCNLRCPYCMNSKLVTSLEEVSTIEFDIIKKSIMAIKKTTIDGTKITCEIESSNLILTEYDSETKKLTAQFKNGLKYEYDEVPHNIYAQFRLSESQGKFFNSNISKSFKYKKLDN